VLRPQMPLPPDAHDASGFDRFFVVGVVRLYDSSWIDHARADCGRAAAPMLYYSWE